MIFKYYEVTPKIIRPIIPVILKSKNKVMLYSALIDSGADYCIFSLDIAGLLGVKLRSKSKLQFSGIGLEEINGYWGEVELRVSEKIYAAKVIFAKISDYGHGILGQLGFFDHFDVKLSHSKQIIEVEPAKLLN